MLRVEPGDKAVCTHGIYTAKHLLIFCHSFFTISLLPPLFHSLHFIRPSFISPLSCSPFLLSPLPSFPTLPLPLQLEVLELSTLTSSSAADFSVIHALGSGNSGLVVAATCKRPGLPVQDKRYAVKLLYNFSHEYSSVMNNSLENEWLILSRLLPHPNIVRFWAQFVSTIPTSFSKHLPDDLRAKSVYKDRSGVTQARKGQFLVLDHHQQNLIDWMDQFPLPLSYEVTLNMTEQILHALLYLERNTIRHLDLKRSNILITNGDCPVICDFGCAVQFPDATFVLAYTHGVPVGGNRAHLAPEVLSTSHKCRHEPSNYSSIDYSKQASFAAGILICEIATGAHPLQDYPLGFSTQGTVKYSTQDLTPLPEFYPKSFHSIIGDILRVELQYVYALSLHVPFLLPLPSSPPFLPLPPFLTLPPSLSLSLPLPTSLSLDPSLDPSFLLIPPFLPLALSFSITLYLLYTYMYT